MASNNVKYSKEMRMQTAAYIIESGKSATSVGEELGIDKNTVCSWVREYRRIHNLPSYAEEKGIKSPPPKESKEMSQRLRELEAKLKEKDREIKELNKQIEDEKEKVEILKKSLHIFAQPRE